MGNKSYAITEAAGRYVAGVRNTGVGTLLYLTDKQAEAGLRDGTLVESATPEDGAFAVSTISGTAGGTAVDPDTIPKASDPDAAPQAAGTGSLVAQVEADSEAGEGTVPEADKPARKTSGGK